MDHWDELLNLFGPRAPLQAPEGLNKLDPVRPAVFQSVSSITSLYIAARVLQVITARQGAAVSPQQLEQVLASLSGALEPTTRALADEEARHILRWLQAPPALAQGLPEPPHPELDWMRRDTSAKQEVFSLALERELDVELEYYEPQEDRWPRQRLSPTRLVLAPEPELHFVDEAGQALIILARHVRWLMPVRRRSEQEDAPKAKVLSFPWSAGEGDD